MQAWAAIIDHWRKVGQAFYAIHLSDEGGDDPIDWYSYDNCKGVIRNYVRADLPIAGSCDCKTLTLPLGPATGRLPSAIAAAKIADRPLIWSFIGTSWANRKEKLQHLQSLQPAKLTLNPNWTAAANSAAEYTTALKESKFIPCPRGTAFDTFRLWEALEYGCIPLLCREAGDEVYYNWLRSNLPGLFAAASWAESATFVTTLLANPQICQLYADRLQTEWKAWKVVLKKDVQHLLGI
jgi:hypothetical protein